MTTLCAKTCITKQWRFDQILLRYSAIAAIWQHRYNYVIFAQTSLQTSQCTKQP